MDDTLKELLERGLGDSRLLALNWDGQDFVVVLGEPLPQDSTYSIRCSNARDLKISLESGDFVGPPILWSVSATRVEKEWLLELDASGAPQCRVIVRCTALMSQRLGKSTK